MYEILFKYLMIYIKNIYLVLPLYSLAAPWVTPVFSVTPMSQLCPLT